MSSTFKNITIYLLGTVVTFLIFIIFPNIIVLKEDILSLFFSTTAQVFIILLGLWAITFGLMKAFDTRGPETIILSYLNYYKKLSVMINGLEKAIPDCEETTKEDFTSGPGKGPTDQEFEKCKSACRKLKEIIKKKRKIRYNIIEFVAVTMILIIISLSLLSIISLLSKMYYIGLLSIILVIWLSLYSLISAFWIIKKLLTFEG